VLKVKFWGIECLGSERASNISHGYNLAAATDGMGKITAYSYQGGVTFD
jgi:hypothetical protein